MRISNPLTLGGDQLAPRDADFIYNESDGHLSHLIGVYFFETSQHPESEFSQEQDVEWVTARLGHNRMFTQRIQRTPLGLEHPHWVPAPEFDVRDHIQVTNITEPGWAALQIPLSKLMTSRMDLTRPPWELHFFNGIEGLDELSGRLTAVVLKTHHSGADGIAIQLLGEAIFSDRLRPAEIEPSVRLVKGRLLLKSVLGFPRQVLLFARHIPGNRAAQQAVAEAKLAGEWMESFNERPATRFNGKVSGSGTLEKIILPRAEVRQVKDAVSGATINDVLLAVVGGALSRYLSEKGEKPGGSLVAMVPRSMRKVEEWESANQLVTLAIDMHTDIEDPLERLALIAESARSEKTRTSHIAVRRVNAVAETAPAPLLRLIAHMRGKNTYDMNRPRAQHTMVSNFPLSVERLTLNGAPGAAVIGVQPPVDGDGLRHFMGVAAGGELPLNVCADTASMPDLGHYLGLLRASFEELKEAANSRELENGSAEIAS